MERETERETERDRERDVTEAAEAHMRLVEDNAARPAVPVQQALEEAAIAAAYIQQPVVLAPIVVPHQCLAHCMPPSQEHCLAVS